MDASSFAASRGAAPREAASGEAQRRAGFAREVRSGLTARPKRLHCRFFYDEEGSRLFEAICELPEYYLTRAEREILDRHADDIAAAVPGCETLVELGSGSAAKTRLVIHALLARSPRLRYVPVDISREILEQSSLALLADFPALSVTALSAEYEDGLRALPGLGAQAGAGGGGPLSFAGSEKCDAKAAATSETPPKLVLWLGSNIGNLHREEAAAFLSRVAGILVPRDGLLVGIDRRSSRAVLEPAYDDAAGVTARFNLNLLARINRELGGSFDLAAFEHQARYDEAAGCVEMHLVSRREQTVRIAGTGEAGYPLDVRISRDERIHTENSYKYSDDEIAGLAAASGLMVADRWQDSAKRFTDVLFRKPGAQSGRNS